MMKAQEYGTPGFMAPECYQNTETRSSLLDIYSFGIILLNLFNLHHPIMECISTRDGVPTARRHVLIGKITVQYNFSKDIKSPRVP